MGVYRREDSPYWWMLLEVPGRRPVRRSTKIPVEANSPILRKQQAQDAQDVYAAAMADLARARHDLPVHQPDATTFDQYADWYDTHALALRRGAERDRVTLGQLRAFFGPMPLTEIDRPTVQEYITRRLTTLIKHTDPPRTVRPSTVNREVDVLKGMLRDAVPKYLKASPLAGMKKLRTVKPPKTILSAKDEAKLLAELPPVDQAFLIVAIDTLLRMSNVINLRRDEYKRTHLELRDSKTGPYQVPLSTRARKALESLPKDGDYFFPHRRVAKKERDWRGAVKLMLRRACKRAGIPYGRGIGITFHTGTRATGATRMLRAGNDPRTVQAVGNWKDMRAMQDYFTTDQALSRKAVNSIQPRDQRVIGKRRKTPKPE